MLEFVTRSLFTFIIRSVPFKSLVYECAPIYVRLPIKRNPMTAVTTNTRPQRFFSLGSNLRFGGHQSTVTMGFHVLAQSRPSPGFSSTRKNKSSLQYFATGSGTTSCQDYEKYEFVNVCRRKLKLSTYLQTVSYDHISFLNARSQLVWILASSGFYSGP